MNHGEHKDYSLTNPRAGFYSVLYPELRQIAIDHGYALALHGSMARDMDLIAVAWIEEPKPYLEMIDAMLKAIGGTMWKTHYSEPGEKPHGRMCFNLCFAAGDWFIDISVIPPIKKPSDESNGS